MTDANDGSDELDRWKGLPPLGEVVEPGMYLLGSEQTEELIDANKCDACDFEYVLTTRVMEPTATYVAMSPLLAQAPIRSWIRIRIENVPAHVCRGCGFDMYDIDVEIHLDLLIAGHWLTGADPGGDLTVDYQPPDGRLE